MNWDLWSFIIGILVGIGCLLGFMGICYCMVASRCSRNEEDSEKKASEQKLEVTNNSTTEDIP